MRLKHSTSERTCACCSWIGLPDIDYPTDQYDYQGALSLVKELSIKDGKLYQYPVEAITSLRDSSETFADKAQTNNTYELELTFPANQKSELLLFADDKGNGLSLTVDTKDSKIIAAVKPVFNTLQNLVLLVNAQSIRKNSSQYFCR